MTGTQDSPPLSAAGQHSRDRRASQAMGGTFSPFLGAARTLLSFDGWAHATIVSHIRPLPHDLIVDMQCGGGDLARRLADAEPAAQIVAAAADAETASRARTRHAAARASLRFVHAAPEDLPNHFLEKGATKVVAVLSDARSTPEKLRRLQAARAIIDPLGALFVIGAATQRATRMRGVRNTALTLASVSTVSESEVSLIRSAGFVAVDEAASWTTPFGSVSLFRARAS